MKGLFVFIIGTILLTACTKEVPETEKKSTRSANENDIRNLFLTLESSYNDGVFEKTISEYTNDFCAYDPDSDSSVNLIDYKNELAGYKNRNQESRLKINIEGIFISDDLAAVQTFSSFMMYNPIEKKYSATSSRRSINLLRKIRNDGWKIFRSLSIPAYSYE